MDDIEVMKDFESSERAKKINQIDRRWETLEIGRSFSIEHNQIAIANLRNRAWYNGRKLGKRFRVVQHETCYEVARIA